LQYSANISSKNCNSFSRCFPWAADEPYISLMDDADEEFVADSIEKYTVPCSAISLLMRGVEADVLEIMSKSYSSHSASSVAAATGRSRNQVSVVLKFYAESGIFRTISMGNRRWYILNRDSGLYSTVRELGAMRYMRRLAAHDE
jgi:hypothetical protein